MPSASASSKSWSGYRRDNVRNGGASGWWLSSLRPTAWQRAQLALTRASPLEMRESAVAGVAATSAWPDRLPVWTLPVCGTGWPPSLSYSRSGRSGQMAHAYRSPTKARLPFLGHSRCVALIWIKRGVFGRHPRTARSSPCLDRRHALHAARGQAIDPRQGNRAGSKLNVVASDLRPGTRS